MRTKWDENQWIKYRRLLYVVFLLGFVPVALSGQRTVSGRIIDAEDGIARHLETQLSLSC